MTGKGVTESLCKVHAGADKGRTGKTLLTSKAAVYFHFCLSTTVERSAGIVTLAAFMYIHMLCKLTSRPEAVETMVTKLM